MKARISVSLGLWVILALSTCAFGHITQGEEGVLQGLEAVYVKVERLKAEIEQDGLFGSILQSDTIKSDYHDFPRFEFKRAPRLTWHWMKFLGSI